MISPAELEIMRRRVAGNTYRRAQAPAVQPAPVAKGRSHGSHTAGVMNGTERLYAEYLELRRQGGEIRAWWFEAVTFRLAEKCKFSPDFMVQMPDHGLQFHDVKATWSKDGKEHAHVEEDARVKLRVAAGMFPFKFAIVWRSRATGEWREVAI
jgi:hypothetical protein